METMYLVRKTAKQLVLGPSRTHDLLGHAWAFDQVYNTRLGALSVE